VAAAVISMMPSNAQLAELMARAAAEAPEPPELRRGFLTYAEVLATLEANSDWHAQLRADLQMHTTHSDGKASLWKMTEAMRGRKVSLAGS
jgi:hypothetical protein